MTVTIGVDPGFDGGIVAIDGSGNVSAWEMPTIGAKARRCYSEVGISALLKAHAVGGHVYCEAAPAAFRIGGRVVPTGKLMLCQGIVTGACAMAGIPFTVVPPKTWQKVMFVGTNGEMPTKYRALQAAQRLLSADDLAKFERGARKRHFHDGLVDAYLIARWGRSVGSGDHGGPDHATR